MLKALVFFPELINHLRIRDALLKAITKGTKENEIFDKFLNANGSNGLSDLAKKTITLLRNY